MINNLKPRTEKPNPRENTNLTETMKLESLEVGHDTLTTFSFSHDISLECKSVSVGKTIIQ